jgi:hypothetical protein
LFVGQTFRVVQGCFRLTELRTRRLERPPDVVSLGFEGRSSEFERRPVFIEQAVSFVALSFEMCPAVFELGRVIPEIVRLTLEAVRRVPLVLEIAFEGRTR